MIDSAYDGQVFNADLADVFSAPCGETTAAVKIIDMLGEELLVAALRGAQPAKGHNMACMTSTQFLESGTSGRFRQADQFQR